MIKPQVITGRNGKPAYAVIPWAIWERVRPFAEDMTDEALFDAARARQKEHFPKDVVDAVLDGANPIKTLRVYRGLTQAALAQKACIGTLYLSQIENGRRKGSLKTLRALSKALRVELELIEPAP
jgi:DNA-binding XRE family transcriptional regulator